MIIGNKRALAYIVAIDEIKPIDCQAESWYYYGHPCS